MTAQRKPPAAKTPEPGHGPHHRIVPPGPMAVELQRLKKESGRRRYVPEREIARGGMGVVLQVWDELLRRPLAMKVLETEVNPAGSAAAERFLTEAQIAGALQHPAIVPIHDFGLDEEGRLFFTMPLIEGIDLGTAFDHASERRQGWSIVRAVQALTAVCDVIAYAHARGVIHRDLKPTNVLIGAYGGIHVLDWGLAKVVDPQATADDDGGAKGGVPVATVSGTPPWMAPEQAEGAGAEVSFRTDIYALGALLHRLLAGRPPYVSPRAPADTAKLLELIRRGPPTPLSRIAPDAPRELVEAAARAMQRRPEDRHPRVEDLSGELQVFLERSGGQRNGFRLALAGMAGRLRAGLKHGGRPEKGR